MKSHYHKLIALAILLSPLLVTAQVWNGKQAAVVITYDDGYAQQLDNALPVLDSLGLKATFYVSAYYPAVKDRIDEWKSAAANGHELGNHTLYHPCVGGPGREWVRPDYDLRNYTVRRMVDEIRMTNVFLKEIDGKTQRTFAFTCADKKVQDSFFIEGMKGDFVAARNVHNALSTIKETDLYNVNCYMVNNHTAEQMIDWVKQAVEKRALLVILFHGVGGGNGLDVSLQVHRRFLEYLKKEEDKLWIAPMLTVAEYVKDWQTRQ